MSRCEPDLSATIAAPTVVLEHCLPDGSSHFDWMVAAGPIDDPDARTLITFRMDRRPDLLAAGEDALADILVPHRAAYLRHEGPVAGDRGIVRRLASGTASAELVDGDTWRLRVAWTCPDGDTRAQHLRLRSAGANWTVLAEPVGGDISDDPVPSAEGRGRPAVGGTMTTNHPGGPDPARPSEPERPRIIHTTSGLGSGAGSEGGQVPAGGDVPAPAAPKPEIRHFGDARRHEDSWDRTPNTNGTGAIHVRTFHTKLTDEALLYLDQSINEWLDAHPQYEVKFVTATIGEFTGKIREPHLICQVWV